MERLQLNSLTIAYPQNELISELNAVFEIGKINIILGRSGTGKSTLLKTIAGFHESNCGNITVDGNIDQFHPMGKIALAFQNPEVLFFNATVGDEVSYALKQFKYTKDEIVVKSKLWLSKWGLDPDKFWNRHPMSLSGGEQRKVALAACTVFAPPVIMLDEPLAGLDFKGQKQIIDIISELSLKSIVILVTHDPDNLLHSTKNILVIQDDKCLTFDSTDQFLRESIKDPSIYLLPDWYVNAVKEHIDKKFIPILNAKSVYEFIKAGV